MLDVKPENFGLSSCSFIQFDVCLPFPFLSSASAHLMHFPFCWTLAPFPAPLLSHFLFPGLSLSPWGSHAPCAGLMFALGPAVSKRNLVHWNLVRVHCKWNLGGQWCWHSEEWNANLDEVWGGTANSVPRIPAGLSSKMFWCSAFVAVKFWNLWRTFNFKLVMWQQAAELNLAFVYAKSRGMSETRTPLRDIVCNIKNIS